MVCRGCLLVCTFQLDDDLVVGAAWDGGPKIAIHLDRRGKSTRVAEWPIWNPVWDAPLIRTDKDAFQTFVAGRLGEPGVASELLELAAA